MDIAPAARHAARTTDAMDLTTREVAAANARLDELSSGTPIHGMLRRAGVETRAPGGATTFPLVTAGVHCSACRQMAGGALDFSGDLGVTTGVAAVHSLLRVLAERGCTHAAAIVAELPVDADDGAEDDG